VKFRPVEADSGAIGGSFTHEFHVLAGSGEDAILSCDACDYTSNIEKTEAPALRAGVSEAPMGLRKNHFCTPGIVGQVEQAAGMKDAEHDGMPITQTSKFFLYRATFADGATKLVGAVLRGDHEINPVKVKNFAGAAEMELMPLEEAEAFTGAKTGFMGPVGLKDVTILVDLSLEGSVNLTCGANRTDYHHFGLDPARDCPAAPSRICGWRPSTKPAPAAGRGSTSPFVASKWGRSSSSVSSTRSPCPAPSSTSRARRTPW
jgi:prolyl-tRNA synthetase